MLMDIGEETNEILTKTWKLTEVGDFYVKVHGFTDDGLVAGVLGPGLLTMNIDDIKPYIEIKLE